MKNTLVLLSKAAFKSAKPLSTDTLQTCKDLALKHQHFKVIYDHYFSYSHLLQWTGEFPHPCYLQMVSLPLILELLTHSASPFKTMGLVHLHNHITQSPDFELGQPFDLSVQFGRIMAHPRGIAAEVILCAEQGGNKVYEAVGTFLEKRKPVANVELDTCEHLPYVRPSDDAIRRNLCEIPFLADSGRCYASLSKDYNPIHLSLLSARLLGQRRAIAHGMYTLAMVLAKEEEALNFKKSDQNLVISCDFLKPIWLPSTTQMVTGGIGDDRLITLCDRDNSNIEHLIVRYARGQASRLYRQR